MPASSRMQLSINTLQKVKSPRDGEFALLDSTRFPVPLRGLSGWRGAPAAPANLAFGSSPPGGGERACAAHGHSREGAPTICGRAACGEPHSREPFRRGVVRHLQPRTGEVRVAPIHSVSPSSPETAVRHATTTGGSRRVRGSRAPFRRGRAGRGCRSRRAPSRRPRTNPVFGPSGRSERAAWPVLKPGRDRRRARARSASRSPHRR